MSKIITVKRWVATTTQDLLTIRVPDDFEFDEDDFDFDPYIFEEIDFDTTVLDVQDTGAWELSE